MRLSWFKTRTVSQPSRESAHHLRQRQLRSGRVQLGFSETQSPSFKYSLTLRRSYRCFFGLSGRSSTCRKGCLVLRTTSVITSSVFVMAHILCYAFQKLLSAKRVPTHPRNALVVVLTLPSRLTRFSQHNPIGSIVKCSTSPGKISVHAGRICTTKTVGAALMRGKRTPLNAIPGPVRSQPV